MTDEGNDKFELWVAVLLGLAAIGTAWAGHQSGLWGGNQATAYSESAMIATHAATMKTEAFVDISSDFAIDVQAKRMIADARRSGNAAGYQSASDLYQSQLSHAGFDALGFPAEYVFPEEDDTAAAASEGREDPPSIPASLLVKSLEVDLDDSEDYYQDMLGEGIAEEKRAQARFLEGQEFNRIGDNFSLVVVILTISLFFAGISLVFKTDVRWKLFYMSAFVFAVGVIYMVTLPLA